MDDILASVGTMGMASRLKRVSDMMLAEVNQCYRHYQISFDAGCFPLMKLLDSTGGNLTLRDAANALGISHPAISQKASQMAKQGLIILAACEDDKRSKRLHISPEGQALLQQLRPLWQAIANAASDITAPLDGPLLDTITQLEETVRSGEFARRMHAHVKKHYYDAITIHAYTPALATHFDRLNRAWLEAYFEVEPYDDTILTQPEDYIIARGGEIYFAELDGEIVGTCALFKEGREFELTKMGVAESARGKQVGKKLMHHALKRAEERGAPRVYILTSSKLQPAIQLYRQCGFVDIDLDPADNDKYDRADTKLEHIFTQANAA